MLRATVVGSVWSTRRLPEVPAGAFLEVEVVGGGRLVAFDVLGTGVGEDVLVATGSVASAWFPGSSGPPIDALVIGAVDAAPRSPDPAGPSGSPAPAPAAS